MGPISGERGESREDSRTEENGVAAGAGGATVGATRGEDVLPLVCAAAVLALGISRNLAGPMSRPGALALEEKSLAGPAKTPRHHSSLVHSLSLDELYALGPHENDCPAEPAQSVAATAVEEK